MPIADSVSFSSLTPPDSMLRNPDVEQLWQSAPLPLRVLIFDSRSFVRQWLNRLFAADQRLISQAMDPSAVNLVATLASERPDLVLLSATGHAELTLTLVSDLAAIDPALPILIQGDVGDLQSLALVEAGVTGFVTEGCASDELARGIRRVAAGEALLSSRLTRIALSRLSQLARRQRAQQTGFCELLSSREVEVLKLISGGLRNKEIGQRLFLSVHTVKNHVHNILAKLKVPNRRAAVALAHRQGWLRTAYER